MKKLSLIILPLLFFAIACKKEENTSLTTETDSQGAVISMPYNWKKSLHASTPASNSEMGTQIIYKGNIGIPTTNGTNKKFLTMINPDNGATIWSWDDRFEPVQGLEDIYIDYPHQYNNLLTYQNGDKSYCINLENGTTHWKTKRSTRFSVKISGLGSSYFSLGESSSKYFNYEERVVYKGDINTGNIEEYIIPDFTLQHIISNRIGDVTEVIPYYKDGTQYLAITWQELTDDKLWNFQTYLGLYNYQTNQWVYKKEIMNKPNLNGVVLGVHPIIYQDRIYANIGKELVCHELATGKQIWRTKFTQDFMFSGFIIAENKIIANNENLYTYCLDPANGSILWKELSSGTSGRMSYLNGIVYFVGGSSGRLHAIDVATGKTVWRIRADKLGESENALFKTNAIYTFPAKGNTPARVIALSLYYAYSFNAYR